MQNSSHIYKRRGRKMNKEKLIGHFDILLVREKDSILDETDNPNKHYWSDFHIMAINGLKSKVHVNFSKLIALQIIELDLMYQNRLAEIECEIIENEYGCQKIYVVGVHIAQTPTINKHTEDKK